MKPRTFWTLFIIFIIVVVVIGAALASRGGSSGGSYPGKVYTCTVTTDLGVQSVRVTNLNTNSHTDVLRTEFPFSFNFTSGDVLSFNVTAQAGFTFDAWFSNDGTFHNQNPYTVKATSSFTLRASFTPLETPET